MSRLKKAVKRGLEWPIIFLAAFFFLIATNTQSGWLFVITALLLSFLVVGVVRVHIRIKNISVNRRIKQAEVNLGRPFTVELTIYNHGSTPLQLVNVEEVLPASWFKIHSPQPSLGNQDDTELSTLGHRLLRSILGTSQDVSDQTSTNEVANRVSFFIKYLGAHEKKTLIYTAISQRRSHCFLAPPSVTLCSPLGAFHHTRKLLSQGAGFPYFTGDSELFTVPAYVGAQNLRPSQNNDTATHSRSQHKGGSDDLYGLHEYQEGEDVRFIHWQTSARADAIIVKEFQDKNEDNLLIILVNCASWPYPQMEGGEMLAVFGLEEALALVNSAVNWLRIQKRRLLFVTQEKDRVVSYSKSGPGLSKTLASLNWVKEEEFKQAELFQTACKLARSAHIKKTMIFSLTPNLELGSASRELKSLRVLFFYPKNSSIFLNVDEEKDYLHSLQAKIRELRRQKIPSYYITSSSSPIRIARKWLT
ncbi:MAG: DUF58 domain-containing protein [bacterium]|nr:DUF58 domain-containing protein [bacterium]